MAKSPAQQHIVAHAAFARAQYTKIFRDFQKLCEEIRRILIDLLADVDGMHSIQARAKDPESLEKKCLKTLEGDASKPKYSSPLEEITDLAGVRIITYFPKTIDIVDRIINEEFSVLEKKDVGQERFSKGNFGYQSIHYLVTLHEKRASLKEYSSIAELVCEIQVRTILQHAWAEIEHDISYKSSEDIPEGIKKRFLSLAGMIEIADREFQSIQDEDDKLKKTIEADLQNELFAFDTKLPQDLIGKEKTSASSNAKQEALSVRKFVADRRYPEAISHYTKLIDSNPSAYTLYLGRAKAHFLSGDGVSALADIDEALKLRPNDAAALRLQQQIQTGGVVAVNNTNETWKFVSSGNADLSAGDAEEAFKNYTYAQQKGHAHHFSNFNKAMALILAKDVDGASYFVDQLHPPRGSPTEINVIALRAIIAAVGKKSTRLHLQKLEALLSDRSEFDFSQSPLRYLIAGFEKRDGDVSQNLVPIFDLIKDRMSG